jgi:DNA-binding XRE family transcriptional regulator
VLALEKSPDVCQVLPEEDRSDPSPVRQSLAQVLDDLGRRVAEIRRARGYTQATAAARAGMLTKDYQSLEHGRRAITIRTALFVANALDVPLRALFQPPRGSAARKRGRPRKEVR